jgi:hypothetical protein
MLSLADLIKKADIILLIFKTDALIFFTVGMAVYHIIMMRSLSTSLSG